MMNEESFFALLFRDEQPRNSWGVASYRVRLAPGHVPDIIAIGGERYACKEHADMVEPNGIGYYLISDHNVFTPDPTDVEVLPS